MHIKAVILFLLITPGLVCFYAMVMRPFLRKIDHLQEFYNNADTIWAKFWILCGKSFTVLWGYIIAGVGSSFEILDWVAQAAGDPDIDLKHKVSDALAAHPSIAAYALMAISGITIAARMRSIIRG